MRATVMQIIAQHFRPEFINRIDDVVVFHPLAREHIQAIANIQTQYLRDRLKEHGIGLTLSPSALDFLAEAGLDSVYGARPLKRAIQQHIENPLAQALLSGEFTAGETVSVNIHKGQVQFSKGREQSEVGTA
jgi:ATP-dependent Clp protease ATP-binding subunit ClpB